MTGGGTTGGNVVLGAAVLTVGGNNTSPAAYAGVISGDGGRIAKVGTGKLILSGTSTYTGSTTIDAGTLQFNSAAAIGGSGRSVTVASGATVAAGYAINNAFLNRLAENGNAFNINMTVASGNALDFSGSAGANLPNAVLCGAGGLTYSGVLTPGGNTYRLGNLASVFGNSNLFTVSSALTGAGNSLVVSGNGGQVVISSSSTYKGTTTVNAGATLRFDGTINNIGGGPGVRDILLGEGASLVRSAGAVNNAFLSRLVETSNVLTIYMGNGSNGSALDFSGTAGGAYLPNASLAFYDSVGTGGFTYTGALTPANNTYRFGGSKAGNNINLPNANQMTGARSLVVSGGNLVLQKSNDFTGDILIAAGKLTISGSGSLGSGNYAGAITNNGMLVYSSSANQILSGPIGGSGALTKDTSATSTLTLSGANTYSGTTTVTAGTLALSGAGTLGNGSANLTVNGGAVDLGGTADQTVGAVSITKAATSGDTIGNGSLAGTSYAVSNTSGNVIVSADLLANGAAGLTKSGAGTLTLAGANTYAGATIVSAGTLSLSGAGTLGNGANNLTLSGGSLNLGGTADRTVGAVSITTAATSSDTISNGSFAGTSYAVSNASGNVIISAGLLANGTAGLTKTGAGILTLSGANTYSGTTTVTAGTLSSSGSGTLGNGTANLTLSGGTLDLGGATNRAVGAVSITTAAASGDTISNGSLAGTSYAVSNTSGNVIISAGLLANGTAGLTKTGAGTLVLSGANTYAGETTIAGGVLQLAADNALPATAVVRIGDEALGSGVLDLGGHNLTLAGLYTGAEGPSHGAFWDEVINTSATPATLTLINSSDYLYAGHFAGNLSLAKYGAGRFTVGGVSTNSGSVLVYDGTLQVTGCFVADVTAVPGFGNPQLCGKVDPLYFTVITGILHGHAGLELEDYTYPPGDPLPPNGPKGLTATTALVAATDWRAAVYKAVSGWVFVKDTQQQLDFPTITREPAPTLAITNQPFLVGTMGELNDAVETYQANNPQYNRYHSGRYPYVFDLDASQYDLDPDTKLIVLEDLTILNPSAVPASCPWINDKDYDDAYWVVEVSEPVKISATNAYARESSGGGSSDPQDIGVFTISRGEENTAGTARVKYQVLTQTDLPTINVATDKFFSDTDADYDTKLIEELDAEGRYIGYVEIPDGFSSVTLTVNPRNNTKTVGGEEKEVKEWDEIVRIKLLEVIDTTSGGSGYEPISYRILQDTATVTILDNDQIGGFVNRNVDVVSTGEAKEYLGNGTVSVDVQGGQVTLTSALQFDAFSPVYQGDDNLRPIISVEMALPDDTGVPCDAITATLTFGSKDDNDASFRTSTTFTNVDEITSTTETLRFVVLGPAGLAQKLSTGHYDWDVKFHTKFGSKECDRTVRGSTEIFNRVSDSLGESEFGQRWWVNGLDALVPSDGNSSRMADEGLAAIGGMALMRGDGTSAWFVRTPTGTSVVNPIKSFVPESTPVDPQLPGWRVGSASVSGNSGPTKAGYGGDYYYYKGGDPSSSGGSPSEAKATWNLGDLPVDHIYELFATWVPGPDSAGEVKYKVDGATPVRQSSGTIDADGIVKVDQRYTPGELSPNGSSQTPKTYWRSLGFYEVKKQGDETAHEVTVTLTASPGKDKVVTADAVMYTGSWDFRTPEGTYLAGGLETVPDPENPTKQIFHFTNKYGTEYRFDCEGLLRKTFDRNLNQTKYEYVDADGDGSKDELDTITVQGNLGWKFTYQDQKLTDIRDFAGRHTGHEINSGQLSTITWPDPANGNSARPQATFTYDGSAGGRLQSVTREGASIDGYETTTITYSSGQTEWVVGVENPDGADWALQPFLSDGIDTTIRKPAADAYIGARLSLKTGALDEPKATYTDGRSNQWLYQTDHYGHIAAQAAPATDDCPLQDVWRWQRAYNSSSGMTLTYTEPAGGGGIAGYLGELETVYTYVRGNLTQVDYADGTSEEWEYDSQFSQLTKYIDQMLRETVYELGSHENVVSVTESGGGLVRKTKYDEYTPEPDDIGDLPGGLLKSVTSGCDDSGSGNNAVTTEYVYYGEAAGDAAAKRGLLRQVLRAVDSYVPQTEIYDYDIRRNPVSVSNGQENEFERTTEYLYDHLNQLVKVTELGTTDHDPPVTEYWYDGVGNSIAVIDPNGNTTDYAYDRMNRLKQVLQPVPGGSADSEQTRPEMLYDYDGNGNREKEYVLGPAGVYRTTTNTYNARNELTKTLYPEPGYSASEAGIVYYAGGQSAQPIACYAYDTLGNLKSQTDPRFGNNPATGKRTEYQYDPLGRVRKVTSPAPWNGPTESTVSTTTAYYADGRMKSVTSPGPNGDVTTNFTYDGLGRLQTEVRPGDGRGNQLTITYGYDLRDNLKTVTESGGAKSRVTTTYYDALDRVIAVDGPDADAATNHLGTSTYYTYNPAGEVECQLVFAGNIDAAHVADGRILLSELEDQAFAVWNRASNNVAKWTLFTYDNLGRVKTAFISADVLTTNTYDKLGNVTQQKVDFTDASGPVVLTTTTEYDALSRAWKVSKPAAVGTAATEVAYYVDGNVKRQKSPSPTGTGQVQTDFVYDGLGRPFTTTTDDSAKAGGRVTTTTWHDALGNVTKTKDVTGVENFACYDLAGMLMATVAERDKTIVTGSTEVTDKCYLETLFERNADGSVANQYQDVIAAPNSSTSVLHAYPATTFTYDHLGRVLSQKEPNATKATTFTYDAFGYRTSLTDPNNIKTEFAVDKLGRVSTDTVSGLPDRTYDYDSFGNLLQSTDREGKTIEYRYYGNGTRKSERWVDSVDNYMAEYWYTPLGELEKALDNRSEYEYYYDAARGLRAETQSLDPFNYQAVDFIYSRGLLGQANAVWADLPGTANDFVNAYTYDNRGRLKQVTQEGSPPPGDTAAPPYNTKAKCVTFDYRHSTLTEGGTPLFATIAKRYNSSTATGTPVATTDRNDLIAGGTYITMQYAGDLPADYESFPVNANTIAKYWQYQDPRGLLARKSTEGTNVQNSTVVNGYDAVGQLTAVETTIGENTTTQSITYDENGNRKSDDLFSASNRLLYASDARDYYGYDAEGNVTSQWDFAAQGISAARGRDEFSFGQQTSPGNAYQLVIQGLRVDMELFNVQVLVAGQTVYETQANARPTDEAGVFELNKRMCFWLGKYTDPQSVSVHLQKVGGGSDPCVTAGSIELDFLRDYTEYAWDRRNRLLSATKFTGAQEGTVSETIPWSGGLSAALVEGGTKHYVYDVHNQLIQEYVTYPAAPTVAKTSAAYVYQGGHRVVEILKQQVDLQPGVYETGVCIRLYGQGIDMPLAIDHTQPVSGVPTFRTDWTLTDEQGTVRVLLKDWGGGTLERHSVNYTPFGAPDGEPTADNDPLGRNNIYYAGREYDSFTEFYNNRARWYDPAAGRFISEDPDRFRAGDTNLYRYCHNSPANFTDPSGKVLFVPFVVAAYVVGLSGVAATTYGAFEMQEATADTFDPERFDRGAAWVNGGITTTFIGAGLAAAPLLPAGHGLLSSMAVAGVDGFVSGAAMGATRSYAFGGSGWDIVKAAAEEGAISGVFGAATGGLFNLGGRAITAFRTARQLASLEAKLAARTMTRAEWQVYSQITRSRAASRAAQGNVFVRNSAGQLIDSRTGRFVSTGNTSAWARGFPDTGHWGWENVRARLGRAGWLQPYQEAHHWLVPRGGDGPLTLRGFFREQWGRFVPGIIKNREWNLMPAPSAAWHDAVHGAGRPPLPLLARVWVGSPGWAKVAAATVTAAGAAAVDYLMNGDLDYLTLPFGGD